MALLKSRPKIRVQVPNEIRPGDTIHAVVLLDCRSEIEIEHAHVMLEGSESWTIGSGDDATTRRLSLVRLGARVSEKRVLPKGQTQLPIRIPLPPEVPPSFRGTSARIEYELRVHVSIAWWPDARAAFEIKVVPHPVPSPETVPGLYSSDPEGPRGREPHVELSLASTWTRAGDVVSGALALANVAHNRYSEIKVGLTGMEVLYDGGRLRTEREHVRYMIRIGAEQALDGAMIPFSFRLPAEVAAEYASQRRPDGSYGLSGLRWMFEITVGIRWGNDLRLQIPFSVLPASRRPGDAPARMAPPTVGSDRLRSLWQAVGTPLELQYEAQTLSGRFGETQLVIRRDHQGRDGVYLVAELSYPELFLDLVVEPATGVRKLMGGGVLVGDPPWDRDHYVVARDEEQAAAVLRLLLPALAGARLRRFDDRRLTLELRDSGQSRTRLSRFANAAVYLARAFEAVRVAIPAPTGMRDAVEDWRARARTMGAPLETARMRIAGTLGAHAVEVRLAFDTGGRPLHTWLSVSPSLPFDEMHRFRWSADDGPASAAIAARFRGAIGDLAAVV